MTVSFVDQLLEADLKFFALFLVLAQVILNGPVGDRDLDFPGTPVGLSRLVVEFPVDLDDMVVPRIARDNPGIRREKRFDQSDPIIQQVFGHGL
jgi:hypothetical protein